MKLLAFDQWYQCGSGILTGSGPEFRQTPRCKEVEALRAIVGPLEELLATETFVQMLLSKWLSYEDEWRYSVRIDQEAFTGQTLAEALDAANTARKASES